MDAKKKQTILTIVLVIVLGIYTFELISLGILKKNEGKRLDGSTEYYSVSFNENNGNEVKVIKIKGNDKLELYTPSKEGYKFLGWKLNNNFIDDNYELKGDVELMAIWEGEAYSDIHLLPNVKDIDNVIVNKLNVDEKIVSTLVLPILSDKYGCNSYYFQTYGQKILDENLNNKDLIYLALGHEFYLSDKSNDIYRRTDTENERFISFDEINHYYQRIFGVDSNLTPENIKQRSICVADSNFDVEYDNDEKGYWIKMEGCGAACASTNTLYTDVVSADKENDDIVVRYNIYWVQNGINLELKLYDYRYNYQSEFSNSLALQSCERTENKQECSTEEVMNFRTENRSKLPVYKAIFKKQSDGNYYYSSGEWE